MNSLLICPCSVQNISKLDRSTYFWDLSKSILTLVLHAKIFYLSILFCYKSMNVLFIKIRQVTGKCFSKKQKKFALHNGNRNNLIKLFRKFSSFISLPKSVNVYRSGSFTVLIISGFTFSVFFFQTRALLYFNLSFLQIFYRSLFHNLIFILQAFSISFFASFNNLGII